MYWHRAAWQREIVLSTSIAETSLTIESIRVVVDSGLQRRPRFEQRSGMTRLVTVPVSQAAADQRRGRAGRMGPGVCLRRWSREMHPTLVPAHRPEILEADLTGLVLQLAFWGVDDPARLKWLEPLAGEDFIVVAELDGKRREAKIFKAASYSMDILIEQFADQLRWQDAVDWDSDRLAVTAHREQLLGALTLRSERIAAPESQLVLQAMLKGIRKQGLDCLPWTKHLRRWQERICFLRRVAGDRQQWPDVTNEGLETNRIWSIPNSSLAVSCR
ncbi:MAG: helicase-related protein [Desulfobacterales bacterium]